jgi:hypothetical protein
MRKDQKSVVGVVSTSLFLFTADHQMNGGDRETFISITQLPFLEYTIT